MGPGRVLIMTGKHLRVIENRHTLPRRCCLNRQYFHHFYSSRRKLCWPTGTSIVCSTLHIKLSHLEGGLVDPRLRASNEHIPIVRVPRAGGRPGYPPPPARAARGRWRLTANLESSRET